MSDLPEVTIYCDGAAEPSNPGPMGYGVVLLYGNARKELSGYLGHGSNQVAEVTACASRLSRVG